MKKIALVLAVLLVVGGAAFAEVVTGGEATVSGSVTTTLGMDLQSGVWGADADSSISISIPLANGTDGVAGDDDVYGEIMLTDVYVNVNVIGDTDDAYGYDEDNSFGDLAAKIVAGDIYVGLNSSTFNFNNATVDDDYDVNLSDDWYAVTNGDLAFGFNNGMIGVEVGVGAKSGIVRADDATDNEDFTTPWDGDTAEADPTDSTQTGIDGVVIGASVKYMSDMITVPVYVVFDNNYSGEALVGVSVNPSVTAGAFSLTVPADIVMWGDDAGFDVAPTVSYMVTDAITLGADAYYYSGYDTSMTAVSFLDAGVTVSTDGLAAGLTASVDVDLCDLTSSDSAAELGWGVDVAVGYAIADGLTFNVAPGYDSTEDLDVAASLVFGSAFTGIDNTSITLDYASGCYDMTADEASMDAGVLSLATTISF